jgi:hypothetical protein
VDAELEKIRKPLVAILKRSQKRVIWSRLATGLVDSIIVAILALVLFGTLAEYFGFGKPGWVVFLVVVFLGIIGYLTYCGLVGTSLRSVAILFDEQLGFRDRTSSALMFLENEKRTPFMQAHLEETLDFLKNHQEAVIPFPKMKRLRALVIFLVVGLIGLLPHADRTVLSKLERRYKEKTLQEAKRNIVSQLSNLRKEADLRGLKKLSRMVAAVEEEYEQRIDLLAEDEPEPEPEPKIETSSESLKQSETDESETGDVEEEIALKPEGDTLGTSKTNSKLRVSTVATYQPVGKFDSFAATDYAAVFAELDSTVLDDQLTAQELTNLTEHLEDVVGSMENYAYQGSIPENANAANEGNYDNNSFEQALAPAQQKSFAEFLRRYSSHVGEATMGKIRDELEQRKAQGGEMFNISAPPPKDGEFAIQGVTENPDSNSPILQGSPEQMSQVASQINQKGGGGQSGKEGETQVGGKGAGVGAASRQGKAPAILPQAEGGEYLPLQGKLDDGAAIIQVIRDRGQRNIRTAQTQTKVTYDDIFVHYAQGAQAEVNSESVPLDMRDYIREYFRAIRPQANKSAGPKKEQ